MFFIILGSLFILIGISTILKAFGLNIPLFKFFVAFFFISFGLKLLFFPNMKDTFLKACHRQERSKDDYNVVGSSSTIDLSYLNNLASPKKLAICAKLSHVIVLLPEEVPVRVHANSFYSSVDLPGRKMSSEYVNLHGASEPLLTLYVDSAFSSVVVKA